jgi:tRNA A37 N6-isopentenylltransferase MiaA
MVIQQDSSHPTGVNGPVRKHGDGAQKSLDRARDRKANAALEMRLAHADWDEIAEALGSEDRDKLRQMAGTRLERMTRALWSKAIDPKNPEQMAAQRETRANIDRFAKLFGLDAPTEVVVHSPTQQELEEWVERVSSTQVPDLEEPDIFDIDLEPDPAEGDEPRALPSGP